MDRDIEFLYEIGSLRLMDRQWQRFLNGVSANVTEHQYRVMWLALTIAKYEKAKNTERILKMAMVHDITESRTGDTDYIARQYVRRTKSPRRRGNGQEFTRSA
jgi:putative hydrolase of HD superfamily